MARYVIIIGVEREQKITIPELPKDGVDLRRLSRENIEVLLAAYPILRKTPRGYRIGQRLKTLITVKSEVFKGGKTAKREYEKDPWWVVGHPEGDWW